MQKNENSTLDFLPFEGKNTRLFQIDKSVPLGVQMQFYKKLATARLRKPSFTQRRLTYIESLLYDKRMGTKWLKNTLVQLAATRQIKAYRLLEDFLMVAPRPLYHWAVLAEFDARIALEASLSDLEYVAVITTGLGGRDNLLRYSTLFVTKNRLPLQEYQRDLLKEEVLYALEGIKGEFEESTYGDSYAIFSYLIPYGIDPSSLVEGVVAVCNEVGDFIDPQLLHTTNVKPLKSKEVAKYLQSISEDKGITE
ncbi:hypothetical protein HMPREF1869_00210 [Bacteroidales bacterium KA00251]|nr:hypothetical protein HMPREF1869_00210 [Bacteroidales bacterium KA00251]